MSWLYDPHVWAIAGLVFGIGAFINSRHLERRIDGLTALLARRGISETPDRNLPEA